MKKIICMLLTIVLVMSLFAGCDIGTEVNPTTEPTYSHEADETTVTKPEGAETETLEVEITAPKTEMPTEETKVPETEVPTEAPKVPDATKAPAGGTTEGTEATQPATCQHDYKSKVVNPTCDKAGYTEKTCTKCGNVIKFDERAKLGHDWGIWVQTKAPTTEANGEEMRNCYTCGKTETRSIDKLPVQAGGNDEGSSDEGGYYWFGNQKIYWNCASQGHKTMGEPEVIQRATCVHDKIVKYTCIVIGCGATWEKNLGGAGSVSHTMSAADRAKITRGDYFYHIKCNCGHGVNGNTRDEAMAKHNTHVAENLYDGYCGIMREWDGHNHNFPNGSFACAACGKSIPFEERYAGCGGETCKYG